MFVHVYVCGPLLPIADSSLDDLRFEQRTSSSSYLVDVEVSPDTIFTYNGFIRNVTLWHVVNQISTLALALFPNNNCNILWILDPLPLPPQDVFYFPKKWTVCATGRL